MKISNKWSVQKLRDIGLCLGGLTYSPEDVVESANDGLLVLRSSNVQNARLAFSDTVYVHATLDEDALTRAGDILVCVRNGSRGLIGKSALISGEGVGVAHGAFMMLFRAEDSPFVYQLFQSREYFKQVHENLGATINSINSSDFYRFQFAFPPKAERTAIAKLLATWDTTIEKTERLIALRIRQRTWLLSNVMASQGSKSKLADFLIQRSRPVAKPSQPYWALGIRSHGKGTFQRFVEDPNSVDMDELYAVKRDDIIVNITFAWEGAIAAVKAEDEHCLVSHRFPSYEVDRDKADPAFVKYILNCKPFFSQLALISPGGAGRNRVLNKKDFLKLTVSLPSLAEQKRLAITMTEMDALIERERALLAALKTQKRGLMQKLLTGKWRVPLSASEASEVRA